MNTAKNKMQHWAPHLHMIVLDGTWREEGGELAFEGLSHLRTSEVGEVLERLVRRMERHLRRCGLLGIDGDEPDGESDPEGNLAAGQWVSRVAPLEPHAIAYDRPTVRVARWFHYACGDAGERSPPEDERRCSATCCVLRSRRAAPDGLMRITLKKAYVTDDCDRHGPAVAAVPASLQHAEDAYLPSEQRKLCGCRPRPVFHDEAVHFASPLPCRGGGTLGAAARLQT
jgi:hypothetical protein